MPRTLALTCLFFASCGERPPSASPETGGDSVYTTFYPTTYFAERISGGHVPIVCPLPADADPIFWQPSREALTAYQSAGLIVINGASLEKWIEKASLPPSRIVDSAAPLADQLVRYETATVHKHGPGGEHAHEGIDGHTWLDPVSAIVQATEIHAAMAKRWPAHAADFRSNFEALLADLSALDTQLKSISPPPLLASHPAYNYLARRYGWDIDNLDLDPDAMPSETQLADLRQRLATRPVSVLLWESAPLPEIATRLRSEFRLRSIVFSPCENAPPAGEDFLSVMSGNLKRVAEAKSR